MMCVQTIFTDFWSVLFSSLSNVQADLRPSTHCPCANLALWPKSLCTHGQAKSRTYIAVSLANDSTSALLVKHRGVSGYYVCYDLWTSAFSDVVCRQLGHRSVYLIFDTYTLMLLVQYTCTWNHRLNSFTSAKYAQIWWQWDQWTVEDVWEIKNIGRKQDYSGCRDL